MISQINLPDEQIRYIIQAIKGISDFPILGFKAIIDSDKKLADILIQSDSNYNQQKRKIIEESDALIQAQCRESIVLDLEKELDCEIYYDHLIPDQKEIGRGSRVRLRKDSLFFTGYSRIGTLAEDFKLEEAEGKYRMFAKINYESGLYAFHNLEDLEFVENLAETEKQKNLTILETIKNTPFEEFQSYMLTEIESIVKKKKKKKGFRKFKVGDSIVMNTLASSKYEIAKEGSIGKICHDYGGRDFGVTFTKVTGTDDTNINDVVSAKYMSHYSLEKIVQKSGGIKKYSIDLLEKVTDRVVTKTVRNKLRDKNVETLVNTLLSNGLLLKRGKSLYVDTSENLKYIAPRLAFAYADSQLYSSPDMFSPPSERQPHVLRLELTTGCDHRKCTYCEGFKGIPFMEKTYRQFLRHYKGVIKALGDHRSNIRRLFIGGGNALSAKQKTLLRTIGKIGSDFNPERIAIYGRADAMIQKGIKRLRNLRSNGISLIYLGVESGSDQVLDYVNKGTTFEIMQRAGEIAGDSGMQLSVMVMPGLGGMKYYDAHVEQTAALLNELHTEFITFMTINAGPNTVYSKKMAKEIQDRTNRPLTEHEIVQQVRDTLQLMKPNGQKVGMFDSGVDQVGINPTAFNVKFYEYGRESAIETCRKYLLN